MNGEAAADFTLQGVSKVYRTLRGRTSALKDVDIRGTRGRALGLIGPNGAGKTTLLKLLLGLLRPSAGEVRVFGAPVDLQAKRRMGFLPEESYLYGFLSVRETVEFAARLYPRAVENLARVDPVLEKVGMARHQDRRISQCSKGMARRAALAQTLVHDPELLLLDEPTSGFDPMGRRDVKTLLKDLKQQGKTLLICTHQLAEIEDICDDVIILYEGRVVVQGTLDALMGELREAFAVRREDQERLSAWLAEQGIHSQRVPSGALERFFIEAISKWPSASSR